MKDRVCSQITAPALYFWNPQFRAHTATCSGFASPWSWHSSRIRYIFMLACLFTNRRITEMNEYSNTILAKPIAPPPTSYLFTRKERSVTRAKITITVFIWAFFSWLKSKTIYNGGKGKQFLQARTKTHDPNYFLMDYINLNHAATSILFLIEVAANPYEIPQRRPKWR